MIEYAISSRNWIYNLTVNQFRDIVMRKVHQSYYCLSYLQTANLRGSGQFVKTFKFLSCGHPTTVFHEDYQPETNFSTLNTLEFNLI